MFGCGNGLLITDFSFNTVSEINLESEVEGIESITEDLVLFSRGEQLKLLDLTKM